MKKTELRKALDAIDRVLVRNDDTAAQLWDVLSALRGPDNESYIFKHDHIVPIRRAAFPQTAESVSETGGYTNRADFSEATFVQPATPDFMGTDGHIISHAKRAAWALGLMPQHAE